MLGTHTVKLPRKWWDNPDAFQKRFLFIDVKEQPVGEDESGEDESGDTEQFIFRFRTPEQATSDNDAGSHHWVKVGSGMGITSVGPAMTYAARNFGQDAPPPTCSAGSQRSSTPSPPSPVTSRASNKSTA